MDKNCDPIASGIKRILNDKGLVQKSVARRAGFSEQQFSAMLNGRKIIKAADLVSISEALGVSVNDLFAAGEAAG